MRLRARVRLGFKPYITLTRTLTQVAYVTYMMYELVKDSMIAQVGG